MEYIDCKKDKAEAAVVERGVDNAAVELRRAGDGAGCGSGSGGSV